MLKTLDILIGTVTVLLIFSMAVTVITQAITAILNRKGKHLRDGITNLLRQLGVSDTNVAKTIAEKILKHPMISVNGKLGSVIHREELMKILLDLGSGQGAEKLEDATKEILVKTLKNGGIADPAEALKNIHDMAQQLETANPGIANYVRDGLAVLHGAPSDFVARLHSWFDQSIDRVSERFTQYTHGVVVAVSLLVVLFVQLDIIAVVQRLSIDDQFRATLVESAVKDFSARTTVSGASPGNQVQPGNANIQNPPTVDPKDYYNLLNKAGLITIPGISDWWSQLSGQKFPGMLISVLLLSMGAPFWYSALAHLLQLRSAIAGKDDAQRGQRQGTIPPGDGAGPASAGIAGTDTSSVVNLPKGESGNLAAVG
jgi:hypothetical protein